MLFNSADPIEGDGDGPDDGMDEPEETVTEHRVITRHKKSGKILSNKRHGSTPTGAMGRKQPPRGGSLHPDGSMTPPSGKGPARQTAPRLPATGSAPSTGSSKPGAMGPVKDGRAKISSILARFGKKA